MSFWNSLVKEGASLMGGETEYKRVGYPNLKAGERPGIGVSYFVL